MTTGSTDLNSRVDEFLRWFQALEAKDQEELMALVYNCLLYTSPSPRD